MAKEKLRGVIESSLEECSIIKTVPKSQKSFRITTALLKNLTDKAAKINKRAKLYITIQDGENYYEVIATILRNKGE